MAKSSGIRRGATEFVVIVAGVLVALWIDAGWSWLQDRNEEVELLEDLAPDFVQNAEQAEALYERYQSMASRADWVLANGGNPIPQDSVAPFIGSLSRHLDYSPIRGAVDGAFRSGRVSVLRDAQVRTGLAEWDAAVEDLRRELERVGASKRSIGDAFSRAIVAAGGHAESDPEAAATALQVLAVDPEFRALLINLVRDLGSSQSEVRGVARLSRQVSDELQRSVNAR